MNEFMVFENEVFGNIRVKVVNNEPYFCGLDAARALGYAKPRNAVARHCKNSIKLESTDSLSRRSVVSFIPKSDLFRLVTWSKLPSAEKFRSWVFDEVLPQIDKTGGYIPISKDMNDDEIVARAFSILNKTIEEKDSIIGSQNKRIETLEKEVVTLNGQIEHIKNNACIGRPVIDELIHYMRTKLEMNIMSPNGSKYKQVLFEHFGVSRWREIKCSEVDKVKAFIDSLS